MRITTKGQITIPIEIRERLGLLPWTEVAFELDGNAVRVTKKSGGTSRGQRLLDAMRRAPRPRRGMTTDQLMKLTRGA
jgi:AbrB family looped-hinge helix DNA binding protein